MLNKNGTYLVQFIDLLSYIKKYSTDYKLINIF